MKFLTKEEADKYIQEADELRTTYLNSNYYTRDVCDIIFQHLNLKENDCHTEFVYEFQTEIEFMALYQQLLDVCPEAFSDRKQELIKDSLQKSIYASIRPNLFPNYITELENNNRDSFLVIPVLLKNIPGSSELHGVTLILMKKKISLLFLFLIRQKKDQEGIIAESPTMKRRAEQLIVIQSKIQKRIGW